MDSLRVAPIDEVCRPGLCCRCVDFGPWDRIASKGYCPNCQEMLALGETQRFFWKLQRAFAPERCHEPLIERRELGGRAFRLGRGDDSPHSDNSCRGVAAIG